MHRLLLRLESRWGTRVCIGSASMRSTARNTKALDRMRIGGEAFKHIKEDLFSALVGKYGPSTFEGLEEEKQALVARLFECIYDKNINDEHAQQLLEEADRKATRTRAGREILECL